MPARKKKTNKKKAINKESAANIGYEAKWWKIADALRGSMDAGEYKHVALGPLFPKYINYVFEEKHAGPPAERVLGVNNAPAKIPSIVNDNAILASVPNSNPIQVATPTWVERVRLPPDCNSPATAPRNGASLRLLCPRPPGHDALPLHSVDFRGFSWP